MLKLNHALMFQLEAIGIVLILFAIIKLLLARNHRFTEFLIGDEGGYSLSRLQLISWVVIIISMQIAPMLAAAFHATGNHISEFSIVLSENINWILGISLGSYVAAKGISVKKTMDSQKIDQHEPGWGELLVGDNDRIDFSRFQMLIWTAIGIFIYLMHCNHYISGIITASSTDLINYFPENIESKIKLPTIDISLLVLMGMSQGAYLGKKLIPSFKVEEVKKKFSLELETELNTLDIGLKFKENELELMKQSGTASAENLAKLQVEITKLRKSHTERQIDLDQLKNSTAN